MKANEQRVREFAYQIWESEGKPHGQASRHWEMACKLATSPATTKQTTSAKPSQKKSQEISATITKPKAVKKIKTNETIVADPVKNIVGKTKTAAKSKTETLQAVAQEVDIKKVSKPKKTKTSENQLS